MFELGGLFATVETIETTPLDLLSLPREIAPGVVVAPAVEAETVDTRTHAEKVRDAVRDGERAYIEQTETVPMFHGQAAAVLDRINAKVHNDRRPVYGPEPVDPDSSDARWLAMVGPFTQTVYAPGANPDPRLCRTFSFVCSCGDCAVGFHRAADALHYRDSHRAEHDAYGHAQAPADQTVIGNADPGALF